MSSPKRPVDSIFPGRREAIGSRRCVPPPIGCGGPVTGFRDKLSEKEYGISGLCQHCQDSVFGGQPECPRCGTKQIWVEQTTSSEAKYGCPCCCGDPDCEICS